jgi:hypothetical protein
VSRRNRVVSCPVGVAAAGRKSGDIEQILGGKSEAGQWPARPPLDPHPLARNKGVDVVRLIRVWHLKPRRIIPHAAGSGLPHVPE